MLVSAVPAAAQDPGPIVTAQRRPEALREVPMAVSLFTPRTLDDLGISDTLELVATVPNLVASSNVGLGSANSYFLRGLGSTESLATFEPAVGVFVDEVPLTRQGANNFAFFDVERVEVLRGPQGTLLGRTASAGAVSLFLKPPGDRLGGFVEGGYGSYDRKLVRGSIDLPVASLLSVKLTGFYQDDDGRASNSSTGERTNDGDMAGLRLAARLTPVADLTWDVALSYLESNGENLPDFDCDPADVSRCRGRFVTTGLSTTRRLGGVPQYGLPVSGAKADFPLGNRTATTLLTSNLGWVGEHVALHLITGVSDVSQRHALDFADGRGFPDLSAPVPTVRGFRDGGYTILNDSTHQMVSQEVKLSGDLAGGRVAWIAGAYLGREQSRTDFADLLTQEDGTAGGAPRLLADRVLTNETRSQAGYAQVEAWPLEALRLTAGIRYTDEEKRFSIRDNRAACAAAPAAPGCLGDAQVVANGVPQRLSTAQWTPRLAVDVRVADGAMLFASATKGFRSGGWNGRATDPSALLPFAPESVWSYEGGAKTAWLGGRLRANLTGFVLDVTGLQTPSAAVDAADGSLDFVTRNLADYRNRGLELELAATPVDGLNLFLNLGWQDDRYDVPDTLAPDAFGVKSVRQQQADCRAQLAGGLLPLAPGAANAPDCAAGIVTATGEIATPIRTPDVTLAAGGRWDIPVLTAGIVMTPSATLLYRSASEAGTANATLFEGTVTAGDGTVFPANPFGGNKVSGSFVRAHWLLNAGFAIRTDDDAWLMVVECENCLDRAVTQSSLANLSYLNPPRTWMLRARRQF
jgi:iron complex outermembrane receptor protein